MYIGDLSSFGGVIRMPEHQETVLKAPDERLEDLQLHGLQILQKQSGFRFGMDAVLLADFARIHANDRVADFGTGTGILPFLLYGRNKGALFEAFEVQEQMADMARRSVQINDLNHCMHIHAESVVLAPQILGTACVDAVICNPPYGISGKTLRNPSEELSVARHQNEEGLSPWFEAAVRILKPKGKFFMVYPASRMLEAMDGLRKWKLEPKHFRLVYPSAVKPANLALIEAVLYAKPMLHAEPPLIVYDVSGQPTQELDRIYHPGRENE